MKTCKVSGCSNESKARNWCYTHYKRWQRHRDPTLVTREYHGMTDSSMHNTWMAMIARCENKANHAYHNYGGRGIKVCKKWRNSFLAFYKDMGPKPGPSLTIERINNDKGYFPSNVKWATRLEQAQNKRSYGKNN